MVDVKRYEVIKKHEIPDSAFIVYLLKSDGLRCFSAVRSPNDVSLEVGDLIEYCKGNIWHDKDENPLKIEGNSVYQSFEEAEQKFHDLIA